MVYVDSMADRQAKIQAEQEAAIERGRASFQRREEEEENRKKHEETLRALSYSSTGGFGSTRGLIDWDMLEDREKRALCATQGCKRSIHGGILGGPYCQQCADEGFLDSISGRF